MVRGESQRLTGERFGNKVTTEIDGQREAAVSAQTVRSVNSDAAGCEVTILVAARLRQLAALRDEGHITTAEFAAKRAELLRKL